MNVCFSAGDGISFSYIYLGVDEATGDVAWSLISYSDEVCKKSYSKISFSNPQQCTDGGSALSIANYVAL